MSVRFYDNPREFLEVAGGHIAAEPVVSTVLAGVTTRMVRALDAGEGAGAEVPCWWVVAHGEDGEVLGVGMRTMPTAPWAAYLLPMPDADAVAIARAVHERGEEVLDVNGALEPGRACIAELSRLTGVPWRVARPTRLHELGQLVPPLTPPGRLRAATPGDLDIVEEWFGRFHEEADAQAGRAPTLHGRLSRDTLAGRVADGLLHLWEDVEGRVVQLTGCGGPDAGVSRIGPVYTPPEHRRRGYAAAAVAELARRMQEQGARVCLFTDVENPTSNALYERLGFRPVVDQAEFSLRPPTE